jgi:pilus assembly protein Flp/PilA
MPVSKICGFFAGVNGIAPGQIKVRAVGLDGPFSSIVSAKFRNRSGSGPRWLRSGGSPVDMVPISAVTQGEECVMSKLLNVFKRTRKDESGAALIEYSILIGLITVLVISTIVIVGQWVGTQWTTLESQLNAP